MGGKLGVREGYWLGKGFQETGGLSKGRALSLAGKGWGMVVRVGNWYGRVASTSSGKIIGEWVQGGQSRRTQGKDRGSRWSHGKGMEGGRNQE